MKVTKSTIKKILAKTRFDDLTKDELYIVTRALLDYYDPTYTFGYVKQLIRDDLLNLM